jgi:hypothetical protein
MGRVLALRNRFNERWNGLLDSFAATLMEKALVRYLENNLAVECLWLISHYWFANIFG